MTRFIFLETPPKVRAAAMPLYAELAAARMWPVKLAFVGRSSIIENSPAELRREDFNNSVRTLRRLEPGNAKRPYASDNSAPSLDVVNAYRDEVEAAKQRVAAKISGGHALRAHQMDFGYPSQAQLNAIVSGVLNNPSRVEDLPRGRTIFYGLPSNTVVFLNPADRDGGTAFRPMDGELYLDDVKGRR
jgi:hypothetical protein